MLKCSLRCSVDKRVMMMTMMERSAWCNTFWKFPQMCVKERMCQTVKTNQEKNVLTVSSLLLAIWMNCGHLWSPEDEPLSDPVTSPLAPPAGQSFHLFSDISSSSTIWNGTKFCRDVRDPQRMNPDDSSGEPHNDVDIFGFFTELIYNCWMYYHEIWFRHSCPPQDELTQTKN